MIAVLIILSLVGVQTASACSIPDEYKSSPYMNSVEVWIASEKNIDQPWAQGCLREHGQGYTDHGISAFPADTDAFVKQRGVAELRTVMIRYAYTLNLPIPDLLI